MERQPCHARVRRASGAVWAGQGRMGCCLLWPAAAPPRPHPQTSLACPSFCLSARAPLLQVSGRCPCGASSAPPPPHLFAKPALGEPGSAAATRVHLCLCPLEHGQTHSALRPAPRPVKGRSPEQSWTRFGDEASGELAAGKTALPVGEKIKRSPTPALSPPCVLPPRAPE